MGPQASQSGEKVGDKPAEGEQKTDAESCSGDGGEDKTDTQQNKTSQDSKASELDYAKDMAKNVGSKYWFYQAPFFWILLLDMVHRFNILMYSTCTCRFYLEF